MQVSPLKQELLTSQFQFNIPSKYTAHVPTLCHKNNKKQLPHSLTTEYCNLGAILAMARCLRSNSAGGMLRSTSRKFTPLSWICCFGINTDTSEIWSNKGVAKINTTENSTKGLKAKKWTMQLDHTTCSNEKCGWTRQQHTHCA